MTHVADAARFGTVEVVGGCVQAFLEKGRATAGWINAGLYAIRRAAIETIPRERPSSLEMDHFPRWAIEQRLVALEVPPPLYDIGTPDGWAETDRALAISPMG